MAEHDREKLGIFNDRNAGSGAFDAENVYVGIDGHLWLNRHKDSIELNWWIHFSDLDT